MNRAVLRARQNRATPRQGQHVYWHNEDLATRTFARSSRFSSRPCPRTVSTWLLACPCALAESHQTWGHNIRWKCNTRQGSHHAVGDCHQILDVQDDCNQLVGHHLPLPPALPFVASEDVLHRRI